MLLRSRQQEFVDKCMVALADNDNTLGVAPTGAGKTIMLSAVIGEMHKQNSNLKACVLAHRDELTAQNEEKFKWFNPAISTSIVDSYGKSWDGNVTFAMVQTLSRENNLKEMPPVDLLVVDEAHHVTAPSYKNILEHAYQANPNLKLLGVTATPERGDKSSLGEIFSNCCDQIKIGELILSGNLVRPVTFAIDMGNVTEKLKALKTRSKGDYIDDEVASILDSEPLNSEVIRHWREKAGDRKTVIFCSNIAHAKNVANLVEQEQVQDKKQKPKRVLSSFEMAEIDLLEAVNFHFMEFEDESLLASGFYSWAYVQRKCDIWIAVGGRQERTYTLSTWDNEPMPDIPTRVIHQGGKLEAIAAANDFLSLYEKQETAMKTASWRNQKPTERQLNILPSSYKGDESLTRGDASAIITYTKIEQKLNELGIL